MLWIRGYSNLIKAPVSASVMESAIRSFRGKPEFELLDLPAFAPFGSRAVSLCIDLRVPGCTIRCWHQAKR